MLSREDVVAVYEEVLGRSPSEAEVAHQLGSADTLSQFLKVVMDSEEYAERLRERGSRSTQVPAVVNVYHPDLADWGFAPGTRSPDGDAIVGREGWLFLSGGTNANLEQYLGAKRMEPGWLGAWQAAMAQRRAEMDELSVASCLLVVPDKLAVYEEHYPEPLPRRGPRPVERLLAETDLPVVYPLAELRAAAAAGEEVYLRTDTHLTFRGNELLYRAVAGRLGADLPATVSDLPLRSYPVAGDLGGRFEPQILGIVHEPNSLLQARIVEDNRARIEAVRGHIGTRRVFRNDAAPDPRVAVVFGDSFGFAATHYQGLSWFMAQVFREVHFTWIPFGWDGEYVRRVGAEAVLVQGAERFVARVPRASIKVSRLAEETLSRKQPIEVEQVFT